MDYFRPGLGLLPNIGEATAFTAETSAESPSNGCANKDSGTGGMSLSLMSSTLVTALVVASAGDSMSSLAEFMLKC